MNASTQAHPRRPAPAFVQLVFRPNPDANGPRPDEYMGNPVAYATLLSISRRLRREAPYIRRVDRNTGLWILRETQFSRHVLENFMGWALDLDLPLAGPMDVLIDEAWSVRKCAGILRTLSFLEITPNFNLGPYYEKLRTYMRSDAIDANTLLSIWRAVGPNHAFRRQIPPKAVNYLDNLTQEQYEAQHAQNLAVFAQDQPLLNAYNTRHNDHQAWAQEQQRRADEAYEQELRAAQQSAQRSLAQMRGVSTVSREKAEAARGRK